MAADTLKVLPAALRAASGTIAGQAAEVASSSETSSGSAELSGVAAASVHAAFTGFCGAFSQRLSSASAALVGDAGAFTAMEGANRAALGSIAPAGDGPVRQV